MGVRVEMGGSEHAARTLKVGKTAVTDKKAKDKKDGLPVGAPDSKGIQGLETKIKSVQQEIRRIGKGNMPEAEKERLIRSKKAQLDRLTQQKKKIKAKVVLADSTTAKKKTSKKNPPAEIAQLNEGEKKLKALKDDLKKAEKEGAGSADKIAALKGEVRTLEVKLKDKESKKVV